MRVASLAIALFAAGDAAGAGPADIAVFETDLGSIRVELLPGKAPRHVESFKKLVEKGFYDGTTFHRVIPDYIVQGGSPLSRDADPRNDNQGGPGFTLEAEFNDLLHERGVLAMARDVNDPNSAGSQFFFCLGRYPSLDQIKFTIFGRVVEGLELLDRIAAAPRDVENNDRPLAPVVVKKVTLAQRAAEPAPGAARPGGVARVRLTQGVVNVREGPGTDRPVVQRLGRGTELAVRSRDGEWVAVELAGGRTGWVRADMTEPAP